jgi:hypothetical protein
MKRSEMVKILNDSIKYHLDCGNCCDNFLDMSSTILFELEDAGMLPPEYTYWNKDKEGNLQYSSKNGEDINSWEPEDETEN